MAVAASGSSAADISSEGPSASSLQRDLDRIFDVPALSGATLAVHVESLSTGRLLYSKANTLRVMPASVMKILTVTAAADLLGWDHRFETRLETAGRIEDGALQGDLIISGDGDPSIAARDLRGAPLFDEWADVLRTAGVTRINGRLVGDDNAFDDEPLGAGWAWDYLSAGYAAPSGALSYNENVVVVRLAPGARSGDPAIVEIGPPGHGLTPDVAVTTGPAGSAANVSISRAPGSLVVTVRGSIPAGGPTAIRTTTIVNPTTFFVEGLRVALAARGIGVSGGAWDIDDLQDVPAPASRRTLARHQSEPLSSLAGYAMKVSQNFYGEMLLKASGRSAGMPGSTERGRQAVSRVLAEWGIDASSLVMYDGSGLSRYNYVSASLLAGVLKRAWTDERIRGPFVASLPVGGHDGTLEARMRTPALDRRVQAKTGTISNVRSLAGYVERNSGEKLVFVLIANHFTSPNAAIDAVMEQALARLVE